MTKNDRPSVTTSALKGAMMGLLAFVGVCALLCLMGATAAACTAGIYAVSPESDDVWCGGTLGSMMLWTCIGGGIIYVRGSRRNSSR
jgi:hypothetical protein